MKVLLLTHKFYPDIGGIETISEFLANVLNQDDFVVHVLTWSKDKGRKRFPFKVLRNPSVYRVFQEHKWADIVLENNPCLRLAWPNLFFKRPNIVSLHTWVSRINGSIGWQDYLKLRWLTRATAVIACSDAIRKRCWPEARVISNPFQQDVFRVIPEIKRSNDFVFLGRLVSDKGAELAIKAFESLLPKGVDRANSSLTMTIIGDGPERKMLKELVFSLDLEKKVTFSGALSDIELAIALNRHKYLIVPSIWEEPFGIVALEGMACGCLPIVSDGGGLPDAIGNAGLLFKRGSLEDLKACMKSIIDNPVLEHKIRCNIPKHLELHHPDKIGIQYLEVFKMVVMN